MIWRRCQRFCDDITEITLLKKSDDGGLGGCQKLLKIARRHLLMSPKIIHFCFTVAQIGPLSKSSLVNPEKTENKV